MTKKHNLYQFMFNCEDWLSSPSVKRMRASARGMFIELLANAWLEPDCGLPNDEFELRQMARPDDDLCWNSNWPIIKKEFIEKKGRLYNKRLLNLFENSMNRYEASVNNGKKPPKQGSKPRGRPKGKLNLDINLDNNLDHNLRKTQPTTYNLQPITDSIQPPTAISELVGNFTQIHKTFENRCEAIVGSESWDRIGSWFNRVLPPLLDDEREAYKVFDVLQKVEDCLNERVRVAKGYGKLKNPGGYLYKEIEKLTKQSEEK